MLQEGMLKMRRYSLIPRADCRKCVEEAVILVLEKFPHQLVSYCK